MELILVLTIDKLIATFIPLCIYAFICLIKYFFDLFVYFSDHTYIHTYIHTYVRTYVRTYIHTRTCIHRYIYIYIYHLEAHVLRTVLHSIAYLCFALPPRMACLDMFLLIWLAAQLRVQQSHQCMWKEQWVASCAAATERHGRCSACATWQ